MMLIKAENHDEMKINMTIPITFVIIHNYLYL